MMVFALHEKSSSHCHLCGLAQHTHEVLEVFEMLDKLEAAGESVVVPENSRGHSKFPRHLTYFLFIVPRTCMMLSLTSLLFWKAITGFSRILKQVLAS